MNISQITNIQLTRLKILWANNIFLQIDIQNFSAYHMNFFHGLNQVTWILVVWLLFTISSQSKKLLIQVNETKPGFFLVF